MATSREASVSEGRRTGAGVFRSHPGPGRPPANCGTGFPGPEIELEQANLPTDTISVVEGHTALRARRATDLRGCAPRGQGGLAHPGYKQLVDLRKSMLVVPALKELGVLKEVTGRATTWPCSPPWRTSYSSR
jgi:hypothetical protein